MAGGPVQLNDHASGGIMCGSGQDADGDSRGCGMNWTSTTLDSNPPESGTYWVTTIDTKTGKTCAQVAGYSAPWTSSAGDTLAGYWYNHTGEVVAWMPMVRPTPYEPQWEKASGRCNWQNGEGRQCELPNGHIDAHRGSKVFDWVGVAA